MSGASLPQVAKAASEAAHARTGKRGATENFHFLARLDGDSSLSPVAYVRR